MFQIPFYFSVLVILPISSSFSLSQMGARLNMSKVCVGAKRKEWKYGSMEGSCSIQYMNCNFYE